MTIYWESGHDTSVTAAEYIGVGSSLFNDAWVSIAQRVWLEPGLHTFDRASIRGISVLDQDRSNDRGGTATSLPNFLYTLTPCTL